MTFILVLHLEIVSSFSLLFGGKKIQIRLVMDKIKLKKKKKTGNGKWQIMEIFKISIANNE